MDNSIEIEDYQSISRLKRIRAQVPDSCLSCKARPSGVCEECLQKIINKLRAIEDNDD